MNTPAPFPGNDSARDAQTAEALRAHIVEVLSMTEPKPTKWPTFYTQEMLSPLREWRWCPLKWRWEKVA